MRTTQRETVEDEDQQVNMKSPEAICYLGISYRPVDISRMVRRIVEDERWAGNDGGKGEEEERGEEFSARLTGGKSSCIHTAVTIGIRWRGQPATASSKGHKLLSTVVSRYRSAAYDT